MKKIFALLALPLLLVACKANLLDGAADETVPAEGEVMEDDAAATDEAAMEVDAEVEAEAAAQ
ncbi:hypothetical protein A3D88_03380 [Candidatus Peribacteria bacterium RIFCSPHIGHO2_02_FULL_52_16]|nr:MAG: hypothetical protein A2706_04200 [Candidatus Peribacteria bacterium RIFCSPHIGHO2_01_FULL_51_35]OGJ61368.1 MAG: hypothetical protein A3D88_03380 [Candidatus Peribacteria bacterium RIFCSPHIGHO2_02_FULL_52_16]